MDKERTRKVLQKLIDAFPIPMSDQNFEIPKDEEQNFRNFLMELQQRGLIEAVVYYEPIPLMFEYVTCPFQGGDMSGRFEGMSDAEWELLEDMFPDKAKKVVEFLRRIRAGFEFAAVHFDNWLPLVRSSANRARVLAEDLAFSRKAQGIAGIIC